MKRIICVITVLILLCGCGGKEFSPVTRQISFKFQAEYYNEQFTAEAQIDKDGVMTMSLIKPETMAGLEFTLDGKETQARLMGLTYTPDTENLPSAIVARGIYEVLMNAQDKKFKQTKENAEIKGKAGDKNYTLTVSAGGFPLNAKIPDDSFKVVFSDMTVTKNKNDK